MAEDAAAIYHAVFSARGGLPMMGMSLSTFTMLHVLISLIGLIAGAVMLARWLQGQRAESWTLAFLLFTIATSVTGFGFPFDHLLPSHIVGIISLVVLAVALLARYAFHLVGPWQWVFVATSMIAFYFNAFVLVVQLFGKISALHALAPTQSEPPFAIAQGVVLLAFVALTVWAGKRFGRRVAAA
jgi:hypothetical protein